MGVNVILLLNRQDQQASIDAQSGVSRDNLLHVLINYSRYLRELWTQQEEIIIIGLCDDSHMAIQSQEDEFSVQKQLEFHEKFINKEIGENSRISLFFNHILNGIQVYKNSTIRLTLFYQGDDDKFSIYQHNLLHLLNVSFKQFKAEFLSATFDIVLINTHGPCLKSSVMDIQDAMLYIKDLHLAVLWHLNIQELVDRIRFLVLFQFPVLLYDITAIPMRKRQEDNLEQDYTVTFISSHSNKSRSKSKILTDVTYQDSKHRRLQWLGAKGLPTETLPFNNPEETRKISFVDTTSSPCQSLLKYLSMKGKVALFEGQEQPPANQDNKTPTHILFTNQLNPLFFNLYKIAETPDQSRSLNSSNASDPKKKSNSLKTKSKMSTSKDDRHDHLHKPSSSRASLTTKNKYSKSSKDEGESPPSMMWESYLTGSILPTKPLELGPSANFLHLYHLKKQQSFSRRSDISGRLVEVKKE